MAKAAARQEDHQAKRTRSHDEIRHWAEERGGHPAVVQGTEILRIDFDEPSGNDDENLRRISWDEFLDIFDSRELEFLHQDLTQAGKPSRFAKFVRAGSDEAHR